MRRRYCKFVKNVLGLPVYVYECDQDLQAGYSLFESSFKLLGKNAPVWGKRARQLFRRVIICDRVGIVVIYCPEQRCCYVNPWVIEQQRNKAFMRGWMNFESGGASGGGIG